MTALASYESMIKTLQWDNLRDLWSQIEKRDTPGWPPGKAFEYLVLRTFELSGALVKWPYSVRFSGEEVEQIDGAIYYDGLACLVESKDFTDKPLNTAPIAKLRNQLLRRPASTLGLIFSRTGFTDPARTLLYYSSPQTILLWEKEEIEYALNLKEPAICELLILKYRFCVEHGSPDFNILVRDIP